MTSGHTVDVVSGVVRVQDSRIHGLSDRVLQLARASGVSRMSCNGCHEGDWSKVSDSIFPQQCFGWAGSFVGVHSVSLRRCASYHQGIQKSHQTLACTPGEQH